VLPEKTPLLKSKHSFFKDLNVQHISNGIVAWLFGVTGPLLIVLQAAEQGNLSNAIIISWVFAIYVVGGLLSVLLSFYYRQPMAVAFSIPGALLVGASISNHPFSDIIGVYIVTGILVLILGLTGIVNKMMALVPMPIIMGMVSGVLLPFGINILYALQEDFLLNGIILLTFLLISMYKLISRWFPPILGALLIAFILVLSFDLLQLKPAESVIAVPSLFMPTFSLAAIGELVLPLAITVIAIQNSQGIAIMKGAGYQPPVNAMTNWSGIGSLINSIFGAHSACIAGPMTAILTSDKSSNKGSHYTASVVMGGMWIAFGLFAPVMIMLIQGIPSSVIYLLGGLAMLGVLISSLRMTFSTNFKMGSIFAFIITLSEVTFLGIGAPFCGIVGGIVVSLMVEREDFKRIEG